MLPGRRSPSSVRRRAISSRRCSKSERDWGIRWPSYSERIIYARKQPPEKNISPFSLQSRPPGANACATCKWKLGRPSALPVIFKAAVEMTAAQSENRVGSPYSPEHTRSFEAGADYSLAARFDHTRANKQMLAPKLGISHASPIPSKVVRFRAYLLGNVGIVSIHGT